MTLERATGSRLLRWFAALVVLCAVVSVASATYAAAEEEEDPSTSVAVEDEEPGETLDDAESPQQIFDFVLRKAKEKGVQRGLLATSFNRLLLYLTEFGLKEDHIALVMPLFTQEMGFDFSQPESQQVDKSSLPWSIHDDPVLMKLEAIAFADGLTVKALLENSLATDENLNAALYQIRDSYSLDLTRDDIAGAYQIVLDNEGTREAHQEADKKLGESDATAWHGMVQEKYFNFQSQRWLDYNKLAMGHFLRYRDDSAPQYSADSQKEYAAFLEGVFDESLARLQRRTKLLTIGAEMSHLLPYDRLDKFEKKIVLDMEITHKQVDALPHGVWAFSNDFTATVGNLHHSIRRAFNAVSLDTEEKMLEMVQQVFLHFPKILSNDARHIPHAIEADFVFVNLAIHRVYEAALRMAYAQYLLDLKNRQVSDDNADTKEQEQEKAEEEYTRDPDAEVDLGPPTKAPTTYIRDLEHFRHAVGTELSYFSEHIVSRVLGALKRDVPAGGVVVVAYVKRWCLESIQTDGRTFNDTCYLMQDTFGSLNRVLGKTPLMAKEVVLRRAYDGPASDNILVQEQNVLETIVVEGFQWGEPRPPSDHDIPYFGDDPQILKLLQEMEEDIKKEQQEQQQQQQAGQADGQAPPGERRADEL